MRTNIDIDDELIRQAMTAFGVNTKREAVDRALRKALQIANQAKLRELRGLGWQGDLDAMRRD